MAGSDPAMAPAPILSAGLILCRNAPELEVLLVERSASARVGPGALVFPGGKLEGSDEWSNWRKVTTGDDVLTERARRRRICAIRETFEETGLLLAQDQSGTAASYHQIKAVQIALEKSKYGLVDALQMTGLNLDLSQLAPFSHWITPISVRARFNTVFYITLAPPFQNPCADGQEMTRAIWAVPHTIIERAQAGQETLMFPTRTDLAALGRHTDALAAISTARLKHPLPVQPRVIVGADQTIYVPEPAPCHYKEPDIYAK